MEIIKKEICTCGSNKIATYSYSPGYGDGSTPYHCEDCISTKEGNGCSCNWNNINDNRIYSDGKDQTDYLPDGVENIDWKWVIQPEEDGVKITKEDGYWQELDDQQRPYACCEYDNSPNGYYTEEYEQFLESECKRIKYDLTKDVDGERFIREYGHILWTDELIERVEKIIEEYDN